VNHRACSTVCDYMTYSETTTGSYADRLVSEFSSEDMPIHDVFLCVLRVAGFVTTRLAHI
jgi:hypothetical protein